MSWWGQYWITGGSGLDPILLWTLNVKMVYGKMSWRSWLASDKTMGRVRYQLAKCRHLDVHKGRYIISCPYLDINYILRKAQVQSSFSRIPPKILVRLPHAERRVNFSLEFDIYKPKTILITSCHLPQIYSFWITIMHGQFLKCQKSISSKKSNGRHNN